MRVLWVRLDEAEFLGEGLDTGNLTTVEVYFTSCPDRPKLLVAQNQNGGENGGTNGWVVYTGCTFGASKDSWPRGFGH